MPPGLKCLTIAMICAVSTWAAVPMVKLELVAANSTDAASIATAIQTFLVGKTLPDCFPGRSNFLPPATGQDELNRWVVVAWACFAVKTEALGWKSDVVNRWTTGSLQSRILIGSRVNFHMCSSSDPIPVDGKSAISEFAESVK